MSRQTYIDQSSSRFRFECARCETLHISPYPDLPMGWTRRRDGTTHCPDCRPAARKGAR